MEAWHWHTCATSITSSHFAHSVEPSNGPLLTVRTPRRVPFPCEAQRPMLDPG